MGLKKKDGTRKAPSFFFSYFTIKILIKFTFN